MCQAEDLTARGHASRSSSGDVSLHLQDSFFSVFNRNTAVVLSLVLGKEEMQGGIKK